MSDVGEGIDIAEDAPPMRSVLNHVGEALDRFGEVDDGFIGVPMFDAIAHTMFNVSFQHDLAGAVERRLRGIDLGEDVLAWHVFIDHAVDCLHLADDLAQAAMQVVGVHALFHRAIRPQISRFVRSLYILARAGVHRGPLAGRENANGALQAG